MLRTILMLTLLVLAAGAYLLMMESEPAPATERTVVTPAETLAINTPTPAPFTRELPPLENLARTVERPLFSPTRRPGVPQAQTPVSEKAQGLQSTLPAALPNFGLTAVFRTGDTEVVLLRDLASGKVDSVRLGEEFGGWRVATIEAQRVVLEKNETHHVLELQEPERRQTGSGGANQPPAELPRRLPSRAVTPPVPLDGEAGAAQ